MVMCSGGKGMVHGNIPMKQHIDLSGENDEVFHYPKHQLAGLWQIHKFIGA